MWRKENLVRNMIPELFQALFDRIHNGTVIKGHYAGDIFNENNLRLEKLTKFQEVPEKMVSLVINTTNGGVNRESLAWRSPCHQVQLLWLNRNLPGNSFW